MIGEIAMKTRRKRRFWLSASVLSVLLMSFAAGWAWRIHTETSKPSISNIIELRAFESNWKTLNGPPISIDEILGKRTLMNFWGSWCPPCVAEMPLLNEFHVEYADQNFQVIGFAVDTEQAAQRFLDDNSIEFPSLIADAATITEIGRLQGNVKGVLPYSVLFDENGNLETTYLGELKRKQLQRLVR